MELRYRWILRIAIAALLCVWAGVADVALFALARAAMDGRGAEIASHAPLHELIFFVIGGPLINWWALGSVLRVLAGPVAARCDHAALTLHAAAGRRRVPLDQIVSVRIDARRLGDVLPVYALVITTSTARPDASPEAMAAARRSAIRLPLAGIKGGLASVRRFYIFVEAARRGLRRYEAVPGEDPAEDAVMRLLVSEARVDAAIASAEGKPRARFRR